MTEIAKLTLRERVEQWLKSSGGEACVVSMRSRFSNVAPAPAEHVALAASKLSDAHARRAVLEALRDGADPLNGSVAAAAALAGGGVPAMVDACMVFSLDPKDPQWLALAVLGNNTEAIKDLLALGTPPADAVGLPAIVFATFEGMSAFERKEMDLAWDPKVCPELLDLLTGPDVLVNMDTQSKIVALDALASNINRAIQFRHHKHADLALEDHGSTVDAIARIWRSMDLGDALLARRAALVVFGAKLGIFEKLGRARKDVLPLTLAHSCLEVLAAEQDWRQAESICQSRGWTLGQAAMSMAKLGPARSRVPEPETMAATRECFEKYEESTGHKLAQAKGILEGFRLVDKASGVALRDWLDSRRHLGEDCALGAGEVARALRSFADIARKKGAIEYERDALDDFESEMVALYSVCGDRVAEQSMVNKLANEWGMSQSPAKSEDLRAFMEAWADKLDLAAMSLDMEQGPTDREGLGSGKKRSRLRV